MGGIKDMLSPPHIKTWGGYITPIPPRIYALDSHTKKDNIYINSSEKIHHYGNNSTLTRKNLNQLLKTFQPFQKQIIPYTKDLNLLLKKSESP